MRRPVQAVQGRNIVILLLGGTGAGKSSFINAVSRATRARVGLGMEACTSKVEAYRLQREQNTILLVDTPGFNQTNRSNFSITEEIRTYLGDLRDKPTACLGAVLVFVPLNEVHQDKMKEIQNASPKIWSELPNKCIGVVTVTGSDVSKESAKGRDGAFRETFNANLGKLVNGVFDFEQESASSILDEVLDSEGVDLVDDLETLRKALADYDPGPQGRQSSKSRGRLGKLLKRLIG